MVLLQMFCVSGSPLELVKPEILRFKAFEPVLLIGAARLKNLDIRIRVKGGGHVSQIYGESPVRHVCVRGFQVGRRATVSLCGWAARLRDLEVSLLCVMLHECGLR